MSETDIKLKGIKQVLLSEFREAEEMDAVKGYLWFVRDNESTITNYIYLGSRLYGTAEIRTSLESFINNIVSTDNVLTVEKVTSPEGSTVNLSIKVNPEGGLVVTEEGIAIDTSNLATKEEVQNVNNSLITSINTINQNVADGFNAINQNVADGFNTINGAIENEIRPNIAGNTEKIEAESARALEAENNLQTNINAETNARTADVEALQTNINVETNERKADVEALQTNINVETNARVAEDEALKSLIETEKSERLAADESLQTNINAETNARTADVAALQGNINVETERATAAENALSEKIDSIGTSYDEKLQNEIDRATSEENSIKENISNNIVPELEKAVKYVDVSTETDEGRKAIVLENHDLILGKKKDGEAVNISMVSKWDKVDLGSAKVPVNLNGSEERPTYNDTIQIALFDDISTEVNSAMSTIEIVKDSDNELLYKLNVNGEIKGEINIPKDQFLKSVSYDSDTKTIKFIFETSSGETETNIDLSNLIDAYLNGDGISLDGNVFSIKLSSDEETQEYLSLSSDGLKLAGINDIKNSITVKYLGDFETSAQAENEAALQAKTAKNALMTYTIGGASNGIIVNNVLTNGNVKQYLTLNGKKYTRTVSDTASAWVEDSEIVLASKGVTSAYLFSLTTASTNEDILKGLTYKGISLSESDLDSCIINGYTLIDEMYDHVKVGYDGQAYTFTKVGMLNPKNNVYACIVSILYNKETSQFSVKSDAKKYIIASASDLSALSGSVNDIDARVTSVEGTVAENTSGISSINQTIEEINTNISSISGNVDTLNGQVQTINETLESDNEKITELQGTIGQVGQLSEKITNVEGRVATLETSNQEINETKIPEINNSLADLQQKYSSIETSGITLNNEVSIKSRPTGDTQSPVELLKLDNSNNVKIGSNIGTLMLKSKGRPQAIIDGNEGKQIALLDDITTSGLSDAVKMNSEYSLSNSASLSAILDKLDILEDKVSSLSKTNVESVEMTPDTSGTYQDGTKDYVVSGTFDKSYEISGKSVTINNATISNDSRLTLSASSDIDLKDVTFSGDFPKTNGNAVLKVNNSEYVSFKNMTFDATLYNAVEIGLSGDSLAKGIVFENCNFLGDFSNNAILVFGTQNNAVITINNCYFESVSNVLRLSNRTNTNCTVNLTNCKVDKWDTTSPWQGMIIMQDYTSPSGEIESNNLFSPDKISINIINCTGPNGEKIQAPSNMAEICGTGTESQLIYVWSESGGLVAYDENRYPKITIS